MAQDKTERVHFIASPPSDQNTETFRQFERLQYVLQQMREKIDELETRLEVLEP